MSCSCNGCGCDAKNASIIEDRTPEPHYIRDAESGFVGFVAQAPIATEDLLWDLAEEEATVLNRIKVSTLPPLVRAIYEEGVNQGRMEAFELSEAIKQEAYDTTYEEPYQDDEREPLTLVEELTDALIWCGGASDFGPDGDAHEAWVNWIQPLIDRGLKESVEPYQEPQTIILLLA